jgi:hypothetical protein
MGITRGLNIITDGLVWGYDTGYGVADKNTSTRFYQGKPTTNLINFANSDLNNWTSYSNGNDGAFTTEFGTLGMKINNRTSWNGMYAAFNVGTTGTYTYSAWFRYRGGASNNNGAAVYVSSYGGSDTATTLDKSIIGEWQRVSKTVNVTSTSTMFYLISYGGSQANGDSSSWDVTMPQIEKQNDHTPFVNGSRSNTTSLIDLRRTTDVSLANVSFDSNGQPTFDGTNDEIQLPASSWNKVADVTVEAVVKINGAPIDGNGYHVVVQKDGAYSGGAVYGIRISDSSVPYGTFSTGNTSSTTHVNTVTGNTMTSNKYYHLVYTRKPGESIFYQNGTPTQTSTSNSGTIYNNTSTVTIGQGDGRQLYGDIPVVKIHDRVLTASEIKQNYNAYKNRFNL